MKAAELREAFLKYFESQGHTRVSSSSLLPHNDPSLLFINAGMAQFKDCFLGLDLRSYTRATSVQKCVRAGGKHNDLENVGFTARHHTFFEMLGNFSFGDYFKKDAIHFAWNFVTNTLGLPKDRLRVSVYEKDDEAADIWHKQEGVPMDRIVRFGEKDNFWAMGETGPCGPCTEIFWDQGKEVDGDRWLEFWNCVFMQYNRSSDGILTPLPKPSVDTGMGLERMCAILQGVPSNYDIDLMRGLLDQIAEKVSQKTGKKLIYRSDDTSWQNSAMKVIADHLRSTSFLIADGVLPSNEGRGYVLRRILRRAVRFSKRLGVSEPLLSELVPHLQAAMGSAYPELNSRSSVIREVLEQEESKFFETLERGLSLLEEAFEKTHHAKILPADVVFKLYDTFGFPVDLTALIARERNTAIDEEGFHALMKQQQERSRKSWKGSGDLSLVTEVKEWKNQGIVNSFTGYENEIEEAQVIAVQLQEESAWVCIQPCPFYAEGGGQVSDKGILEWDSFHVEVLDCQKIYAEASVLFVAGADVKLLKKGLRLRALVNESHRSASRSNHTATHLLHAALRTVLGEHVQQAGSSVDGERLRFDFSHPRSLSSGEKEKIEELVNKEIMKATSLNIEVCAYDEAIKKGALALFNEKYGASVRVVQVPGFSTELCGGIHVRNTRDIMTFKIISESAVAAGTRRIEAITGTKALQFYQTSHGRLEHVGELLKVASPQVEERVVKLLKEQKDLEKEVESLKKKLAQGSSSSEKTFSGTYKKTPVELRLLETEDLGFVRERADILRKESPQSIHVLWFGESSILVTLDSKRFPSIDAGKIVKEATSVLGGRGGGQAQTAQGKFESGLKPEAFLKWLDEAL